MDLLRALTVFVQVIDEGSFAAASRSLDLAPAVVTRLVAELEQHLGARLINRTTRSLALTEVGKEYLERARQILFEVEEANELVSLSSAKPRGHLRVVVGAAVAVHQLAERLPEFHALYPEVTLELHSPAIVDTLDEHFDISIISTRKKLDGDFIARPLAQVPVILCASPTYLERNGRPTHPSELPKYAALLPPASTMPDGIVFRRSSSTEDSPDDELFELQPRQRPLLSATHPEINLAAARAHMGITGQPYFLIREDLKRGVLEHVLPEWRLPCLPVWAAMQTRKYVPARTRVFLEFLERIFGEKAAATASVISSCAVPSAPPLPAARPASATISEA
ncbi:LysR family transcriptional regulator [Paucibacter sp. R3-3]|uniref:LysR family transcriptional regulator n=1 Tax=Roseateles agri TaxID=3098619 RepID=A0ABU5DFL9_9BURK|nr:LysR family transcriptional regulator [Paucibacter sp. R3-3]MDY0744558.1 LysR family transcriptional regulator [Paucibacter sp. R3-3]